jgi:hypothetical protein
MTDNKDLLATFWRTVAAVQELDGEADRLCDEANENGTGNDEFEVRAKADQLRGDALHLAARLLPAEGADEAGPKVFRMLDLSMDHLHPDFREDLNGEMGVTADRREYGWLLFVPTDDLEIHIEEYEVPEPIAGIWRYAAGLGCGYVLLDVAADTVEALPTWDKTSETPSAADVSQDERNTQPLTLGVRDMRYRVEISRTYSVTVEIEAPDADAALDIVQVNTYPLPALTEWSGHKDWRYRVENVTNPADIAERA